MIENLDTLNIICNVYYIHKISICGHQAHYFRYLRSYLLTPLLLEYCPPSNWCFSTTMVYWTKILL